MNKMITTALLGAAIVGSAVAQNRTDYTPYGYSFRLGVAFPSDANTKGGDEAWTAIGLDYNFNTSILRRGDSYLSIDMISKEFDGAGGTIWPIMLNNKFFIGEGDQKSYIIGGVGVTFMDFDDTHMGFGGRLGFGMDMSEQLFLQGIYTFGQKNNDDQSPSHFGVYLGYRF